MARIRCIKPEFPHSESMGNVSRDARLTFIMLWTLADDSGRLRGNSRMLASLLFPYDDDAPKKIGGWLEELHQEDCIRLYEVDGSSYCEICNWLEHQKIDKPSASKIPACREDSRRVARIREESCEDQGSRIKDQGKDQGTKPASPEVVLPFESEEFRGAWTDFVAMRSEIKKPLKPTAIKLSLSKLSEMGESVAIQSLKESTANQWQGLFEPKGVGNANGTGNNRATFGGRAPNPGSSAGTEDEWAERILASQRASTARAADVAGVGASG